MLDLSLQLQQTLRLPANIWVERECPIVALTLWDGHVMAAIARSIYVWRLDDGMVLPVSYEGHMVDATTLCVGSVQEERGARRTVIISGGANDKLECWGYADRSCPHYQVPMAECWCGKSETRHRKCACLQVRLRP